MRAVSRIEAHDVPTLILSVEDFCLRPSHVSTHAHYFVALPKDAHRLPPCPASYDTVYLCLPSRSHR